MINQITDHDILELAKSHNLYRYGFLSSFHKDAIYTGYRNTIDYGKVRELAFKFSSFPKTKQITKKSPGSYTLKHCVENGGLVDGYVSNGEMILAAIIAGFKYKINPNGPINCWINVHRKPVQELWNKRYGNQ